ncbi:MAG: fibrobacter succinogenes major paralogous domain-containing protein [Bacteroidales bacterium]|nr:fibrobacter succinogenes major paralogous domain-containing protein [Bacteroidales bacterium]
MSLCVSCNKDDEEQNGGSNQTLATVTTDEVTEITATTATCGGEVTRENGWAVTERGVCWSTEPNPTPSDSHTIDGDGIGKFISEITGLTPDTKYYLRAYAKNAAGTSFGPEKSFTTESGGGGGGSYAGHEYVDLGLSVKWATCNVGADNLWDYGDHFAWGETTAKSNYDWTTYKWCNGSGNTLTKYNMNSSFGTVDNKARLESADDAAAQNWGDGWRMPTRAEWQELCDNTTIAWTTQNGVYGWLFTGTKPGYTGVSLFLPAAGLRTGESLYYEDLYGDYWSSSRNSSYPYAAYRMRFPSDNQDYGARCNGLAVRPVR